MVPIHSDTDMSCDGSLLYVAVATYYIQRWLLQKKKKKNILGTFPPLGNLRFFRFFTSQQDRVTFKSLVAGKSPNIKTSPGVPGGFSTHMRCAFIEEKPNYRLREWKYKKRTKVKSSDTGYAWNPNKMAMASVLIKTDQTVIPTGSLNWLFESFRIVNLISYVAVLYLESRLEVKTRVFKFL